MLQKKHILITIAALILASPARSPQVWTLGPAGLEIAPLPSSVVSVSAAMQADLDRDGQAESLTISPCGLGAILSGKTLRWQSPQAWQVRQALIADLNQDGQLEAAFLVWRQFKPWPVDAWLPNGGRLNGFHNSSGLSCHLILIGWFQDAFRERWAGSALAEPIQAFAAADLAISGKQMLVTLDGSYDAPPGSPATQLKVWEWNGFGFTVVAKLSGRFDQLVITQSIVGQALILSP